MISKMTGLQDDLIVWAVPLVQRIIINELFQRKAFQNELVSKLGISKKFVILQLKLTYI